MISSLLLRRLHSTGTSQHLPRLQRLRGLPVRHLKDFLTDTYGRKHDYLRISITERCNLRCVYCMPEEGVDLSPPEHMLTTEEIVKLARIFAQHGIRKVRLTGGEPTVRKDIVELVSKLNQISGIEEICMTSNGLALHRKLPDLFKNGLTSLNLSLDTLINVSKPCLLARRNYSTSRKLTHLNSKGEARMVAIHEKEDTHRSAIAEGSIKFSNPESMRLLLSESNKKGDVISIARVAGIMAAKKTAELIPLCHPISITGIKVDLIHNEKENCIKVNCEVHCNGKTGVEMEALTGATVSLLTVYDMCKAVDKMMSISDCRVVKKSGGKSGDIDLSTMSKKLEL